MKGRLVLAVFIAAVVVAALLLLQKRNESKVAQDKGKEKQELKEQPETGTEGLPADEAAFYGTYRIDDPGKKVEALEKFISDFPGSSQIGSAKREIFKATVKKWPDDDKRILDAADRVIGSLSEGEKIWVKTPDFQFIAKELFSAGVLIDEAEKFALKSLEHFNKANFAEALKKAYAEWKRPAPSDEVVDREYVSERAEYRTTLGRIYLKQGRTAEGEKILRESYGADPTLSPAAVGLAEIAEKKGDTAAALDYMTTATLTAGYSMADVRGRFEDLYRRTHNGSLDGLEGLLDVRYKKLFPNPIKTVPYKPSGLRGNRAVLAEFFTGSG